MAEAAAGRTAPTPELEACRDRIRRAALGEVGAEATPSPAPAAAAAARAAARRTLRVDVWKLDRMLDLAGEIAIAREIERGEKSIIKALSKTRLVLNEVLALEDRIKDNPFTIQEMFDLSEDDIAEGRLDIVANKLRLLIAASYITTETGMLNATVSIGASIVQRYDTVEALVKRTEQLMLHSKWLGKNRVSLSFTQKDVG